MTFSSIPFILVFLPVFLILYYVLPRGLRMILLTVGSLVFYAIGDLRSLPLLCLSVLMTYLIGCWIDEDRGLPWQDLRIVVYIIGILMNAGMLILLILAPGFWTDSFWSALYGDFSASSSIRGWENLFVGGEYIAPLGISYYTFQSITYLTDVFRGTVRGKRGFFQVTSYMCMFPQLLAGPIVLYQEVEQDLRIPEVNRRDFDQGLKQFSIGLCMKILLADRLAVMWSDLRQIGYLSLSTSAAWLGAFGYSMQLYFDFAGYSVMAVGLGHMLGFHLPANFRLPYMSTSIREFYRRWHMTLGRFFSKYVYIPLGGSRKGTLRTYLNLFIVWLFTAIWHGTGINFLMWGGMLFVLISLEKTAEIVLGKPAGKDFLRAAFGHLYVLFFIPVSWMCFAITDFEQLIIYLGRMFGVISGVSVVDHLFLEELQTFGPTLLIGLIMCTPISAWILKKIRNTLFGNLILAALFWLSVYYVMLTQASPFMYFSF